LIQRTIFRLLLLFAPGLKIAKVLIQKFLSLYITTLFKKPSFLYKTSINATSHFRLLFSFVRKTLKSLNSEIPNSEVL